ncbi:ROK family protein [Timonella sp. A28]|uniref:ROK family protein n=1 Tax=Timonella sp. A28 TaxID=3442640 RepID=UPI003EBA8900
MAEVLTHTLVLALDIGGTNSRGEVLQWDGEALSDPIASASLPTPTGDGDAAITTIAHVCNQLLDALTDEQRTLVRAVGLGVPGVLDSETGIVKMASNLGWFNRNVAGELHDLVGLPVHLMHDVTAAGIAEQRLGAGRGHDDVLAVFLGTGIAATLITGGRVIRGGLTASGTRQPAGEIGHMPLVMNGPLCGCGQRGCLELYCSARNVGRIYSETLGIDPAGPDAKTSKDVVHNLATDPVAREVWDTATRNLAYGLFTATMVTGPSLIILGGGLSAAGDVLVEAVHKHFTDFARVVEVPHIVVAALGQRAGILGVALTTIERSA